MSEWPQNPTVYEINTWAWLADLSQRYRQPITLADVPPAEWDALAEYGFDAVWLMGVWERSPAGIRIAREHPDLQADYRRALPDFTSADVVGSPYSVHDYSAAPELGGPQGLAAARGALSIRGMRLILDYVPNHVAPDHPWVFQHPEYFIQGTPEDLLRQPDHYFDAAGRIIANGRDPYFPAWTDTAQLNAFHPGFRATSITTLQAIAAQCDGVRCDMAMLFMRRVFASTWGDRAGREPAHEYWWEVINAVKEAHPDFLFMAEAYWNMEWELQQQGFDYCYDKRLYDRLLHESPGSVRAHLNADMEYQSHLVRFIENHDEPRAAAVFPRRKARAAALLTATLPGARLFHEGQIEGYKRKLPVQLGRRAAEPIDSDLRAFYRTLLEQIAAPVLHDGEWQLCALSGWPDNQSWTNLVAGCWQAEDERRLVVINLSEQAVQAYVHLPWPDLTTVQTWQLSDPFNGDVFTRSGHDLAETGLYVGLGSYGTHFLHFERA